MSTSENAKRHPTTVDGWNGSLEELAQRIHRMRYDQVESFYRSVVTELQRQAKGDLARGRVQLSAKLEDAACLARQLEVKFVEIWEICEPHEPT